MTAVVRKVVVTMLAANPQPANSRVVQYATTATSNAAAAASLPPTEPSVVLRPAPVIQQRFAPARLAHALRTSLLPTEKAAAQDFTAQAGNARAGICNARSPWEATRPTTTHTPATTRAACSAVPVRSSAATSVCNVSRTSSTGPHAAAEANASTANAKARPWAARSARGSKTTRASSSGWPWAWAASSSWSSSAVWSGAARGVATRSQKTWPPTHRPAAGVDGTALRLHHLCLRRRLVRCSNTLRRI